MPWVPNTGGSLGGPTRIWQSEPYTPPPKQTAEQRAAAKALMAAQADLLSHQIGGSAWAQGIRDAVLRNGGTLPSTWDQQAATTPTSVPPSVPTSGPTSVPTSQPASVPGQPSSGGGGGNGLPPIGTTVSSFIPGGTGNTSSPSDFYGTLPQGFRTFQGYPEGSGSLPLLPGYGMTQQLNNFGIAGLDRNQQIGGGSWAGSVWNPPTGPNNFHQDMLQLPETAWYDSNSNPKPITSGTGGFSIRPAIPYQSTWYLQTYGGQPPPFDNIHQQAAASMANVPAAYPGFMWAQPGIINQSLRGMAPAGWASMLGFTPGAGSK